jgi:transcriptional regulator with XRE-family HTH domain
MSEPDKQVIRQKIVGTLVKHVREVAGRSQRELAASLHVSTYRLRQYEYGERDLLLPQLETVSDLCGVPLGYFFDDQTSLADREIQIMQSDKPRLERKIQGALIRRARLRAGKTQRICAEELGISPHRFSQYEYGEADIPPAELETLARLLEVEVSDLAV